MCGIIGAAYSSPLSVKDSLLKPLSRLEYRGYDSCGFATTNQQLEKDVGKISEFMDIITDELFTTGIAHTRWATHGGKTKRNAHPHSNTTQTINVVHNGIIENYEELKSKLEDNAYRFVSETDTEVIPHYFDFYTQEGMTTEQIIQQFMSDAKGTYAVLLIVESENKLYAFKKDSPLVLGIGADFNVVASDVYAFSDMTTNVIFFEDYQYAVIDAEGYCFYDKYGLKTSTKLQWIEVEQENTKGDYAHFMLKEINEQPNTSRRILRSLQVEQNTPACMLSNMINMSKQIIFVACGTSYHAALIGSSVLSNMGFNVKCVIASEFDTFHKITSKTLVIAISQSGETMDVVTVLKEVKNKGATIAALTNVPYSTIERLSDVSLNIVAGQEVAVASTKAFTNQVLALLYIASILDGNGMLEKIKKIPLRIEKTITDFEENAMWSIAQRLGTHEHAFFLGRGLSYPVSREMALKLKEITYIHAEGQMAAELKHGSIALIDPEKQTPVIILAPDNDSHMISSRMEVEARGAWTITISNTEDADIQVPSGEPVEFAIYACVVGQLLSYYTALCLGRDIDQPRNLAKSVTVQ